MHIVRTRVGAPGPWHRGAWWTIMDMVMPARLSFIVAYALILSCSGCAPRTTARLRSPDPLSRAAATVTLAETGDLEMVHRLVDLLEDRDAAVRLYAIVALRKLVGDDFGFVYYAPSVERDRAVSRWRQALRTGSVIVRAADKVPPGDAVEAADPQRAERSGK